MSMQKKNKRKQTVKEKSRGPLKFRKSVGGGLVEVPDPVYQVWLDFSGWSERERFSRNVARFRELWRIFTTDRDRLAPDLLQDPGAAAAYVTGFHLPNAARAQLLYRRIAHRLGILPGSHVPGAHGESIAVAGSAARLDSLLDKTYTRQRVFDLGCGSAAWTQVWLNNFRLPVNSIHLFDSSQTLLAAAESMIRALMAKFSSRNQFFIESTAGEIAEIDFSRYEAFKTSDTSRDPDVDKKTLDVYMLGYIWNELSQDQTARTRILRRLDQYVEQDRAGLMILADPATDSFAWAAMALRDELVARGWHVVYPCPAGVQSCPMMNGRDGLVDWCFSEGAWRKPDPYGEIEQVAGVGRNKLNATMFVMASPALHAHLVRVAPALTSVNQVVVGKPAVPQRRGSPKQKTDSRAQSRGKQTLDSGFSYLLCTSRGLTKTAPKKMDRAFAKPRGSVMVVASRPAESGEKDSAQQSAKKLEKSKRQGEGG